MPRRTTTVLASVGILIGGLGAALYLRSAHGRLHAERTRVTADEAPAPAAQPPRRKRPATPVVAPRTKPDVATSSDTGPSLADEAAVMEQLRGLAGRDPARIIQLARQWNERLPDSPDAPERAWMVVKSLVDEQRFIEARDEAQTMVNRYPGASWTMDVQRHLLSNPLQ